MDDFFFRLVFFEVGLMRQTALVVFTETLRFLGREDSIGVIQSDAAAAPRSEFILESLKGAEVDDRDYREPAAGSLFNLEESPRMC